MEKYRSLASVFHQYGKPEALSLRARRIQSPDTWTLPFEISGYRCFVCRTPEICRRIEDIQSKNAILRSLILRFPDPKAVLFELLIKEIQASNAIEGISCQRKALLEAWKSEDPNLRFSKMTAEYSRLLNENADCTFKNIEDIRKIYDAMLLEEILREDPECQPDGELFRSGPVFVQDGIRNRHQGPASEDRIRELLEQGLQMISDSDTENLVGIACFHFLFGYVHPFYDGNGWLNRFLCSALLKKSLGLPAALSLSRTLLAERKQYYRAFENCENPMNFSDLTLFAAFFLQTLEEGLDQNICDLRTFIECSDHLPAKS